MRTSTSDIPPTPTLAKPRTQIWCVESKEQTGPKGWPREGGDGTRAGGSPSEHSRSELLTIGMRTLSEWRLRSARPGQAAIPRPLRRLVGQAGAQELRRALPRGLRPDGHLLTARVHLGQPPQGPRPDRCLHRHLPERLLRGQGDIPRPTLVPARV